MPQTLSVVFVTGCRCGHKRYTPDWVAGCHNIGVRLHYKIGLAARIVFTVRSQGSDVQIYH